MIALQAAFSERGKPAATSSRHLIRSCIPLVIPRRKHRRELALISCSSACLGSNSPREKEKKKRAPHREAQIRNRQRTNARERKPEPAFPPTLNRNATLLRVFFHRPPPPPAPPGEHTVVPPSCARKPACSILELLPRTLGSASCCLAVDEKCAKLARWASPAILVGLLKKKP